MGYRFNMAMNEDMAERNAGIKFLNKRGYKTSDIARMLNITPARVRDIINNPLSHHSQTN